MTTRARSPKVVGPSGPDPATWSRMVVDSSPHAIIVTDLDGTVRLWNPAAERIYGWTAGEVVGRNVVEVLVPEALLGEARSIMADIESAGSWTGTFAVRHKDGTMVRAVISNRRVGCRDGTTAGIVGESRVLDRAGLEATASGVGNAGGLLLWLDDALGTPGGGSGAEAPGAGVDGSAHEALLAAEHSARVAAEVAAARLAGLQAVTAALSRALDRAEVADAVFHHGLRHLGGHTASLCLTAPDGTTVDIVHEMGYSSEVKASWQSFPLDAALPASEAIRTGEVVLLRSPAERDEMFPLLAGGVLVGDQAYAIVPLSEDGRPFGALVVGFVNPRTFDEDDIALLRALGAQCAGALRRAEMFETTREAAEAEQVARRAAEEAHESLAFLAEASAALSSSLDYECTLGRVVELVVPRLADWCAVFLTADDGRIRPLAVAHTDPERVDFVRRLLDRYPVPVDSPSGVGAVVRTGRAEVAQEVDDDLLERENDDPGRRHMVRELDLGARATLPLQAGGRVLGALVLATERGRTLSDRALRLGADLAVRAAVAIDNALLFADRTRIARQLQASLLPGALPLVPGLDIGARYAAAHQSEEVGGDFYDVFALDGGRWAVVVGDVRGKGVEAATVTGLARHTIRSASLHMSSPRALLSHLNEVLLRAEVDRRRGRVDPGGASGSDDLRQAWANDEPRFCTVGIATVEPSTDGRGAQVTVCVAGHPLPLVARADGTVETVGRAGSLLGVAREIELHDVTSHLGPGDLLVSFTDGIVERHEGRRFFEEHGVAAVLRASDGMAADQVAAAIEQAARGFVPGAPRDDMAVVVVRVLGPAEGGPG